MSSLLHDEFLHDGCLHDGEIVVLVESTRSADVAVRLHALDRLRCWCEAEQARCAGELQASGRLDLLADTTLRTSHDNEALLHRAAVAQAAPFLEEAWRRGAISAAHVDQLDLTLRRLEPAQRTALLADPDRLLAAAGAATSIEFGRFLRREERRLGRAPGEAQLQQQQRSVRLRSRTDRESGMHVYTWSLDPVTALRVEQRIAAATEALFHGTTPPHCPSDPLERQAFLRAHALLGIVEGKGVRLGRPEIVVVVDTREGDGTGLDVDWGMPVEVPDRVLRDLWGRADVHAVVVRNGVVLHAPGVLDLGRTTRLANRAQRRALRALYRGCAVPGCQVRFDHTTIHHVHWWRRGGRTDLSNLLPLCHRHHHLVHEGGWQLSLHPDRSLTIRLPDGVVRSNGPPRRRVA